jgi:thioredoxin 1
MGDHVKKFTAAAWEREVLASEDTILVDLWAEWCPPCRKLGPVIDALAEEYAGRALIGKLDVDEHPEVASRYGVMSIPTLLLFRAGKLLDRRVGALPREELRRLLNARLEPEAGEMAVAAEREAVVNQ